MTARSPLTKFIGSQRSSTPAKPGRVPFREPDEDWLLGTGRSKTPNPHVSFEKRKQLQRILEKEKNKEKRERIGYVLIHRLCGKFGARYAAIITFFVEEFLNSHEEVTSQELDILEKEIRNAIQSKTEDAKMKSARQGGVHSNVHADNDNNHDKKNGDALAGLDKPPPGKEWLVLQTYQSLLDEEKDKRDREKRRNDKYTFKQALDEQIEFSRRVHQQQQDGERKFFHAIQADIEKYHQEEQLKKEIQRKKHHDELKIRNEQIQDQQRRLQEERDALRRLEEYNLQLIRDASEKESKASQDAKTRELAHRKRVENENEENKRIRAFEKQKEAEEDYRLMQEYAAKLDREAREREEAFQKRMKELESYAIKFENEGAGRAQREEQMKFEQLLLKEQQRKALEDETRDRQKENDRRRKLQAALQENRRQLEQKKITFEEERRDRELKEKFRQDMDAYRQSIVQYRQQGKD